jgi:tetratricopeptide (TPR) repeat protein
MSEDDNQIPSALVAVGTKALAVRSEILIKRGLALARSLQPGDAEVHLKLGDSFYRKADWDGAIVEYREARHLNPNLAEARFKLGLALQLKGDPDGAIAEYRVALRLKPDYALAHNNLGLPLEHMRNPPEALQEYRAAYMLDPRDETYKQNYERLSQQVNK